MNTKIKDGGQAFPCFKPEGPLMQDGGPEWPAEVIPGMTLRDYFAAKAISGELAAEDFGEGDIVALRSDENAAIMARRAYHLADAMLAAREAQS